MDARLSTVRQGSTYRLGNGASAGERIAFASECRGRTPTDTGSAILMASETEKPCYGSLRCFADVPYIRSREAIGSGLQFLAKARGGRNASHHRRITRVVLGGGGFKAMRAGTARDGALPAPPVPCAGKLAATHVPENGLHSPARRGQGDAGVTGLAMPLLSFGCHDGPHDSRTPPRGSSNQPLNQPERNCIGSRLSAPRRTSKCMSGPSGPVAAETTPIFWPAVT